MTKVQRAIKNANGNEWHCITQELSPGRWQWNFSLSYGIGEDIIWERYVSASGGYIRKKDREAINNKGYFFAATSSPKSITAIKKNRG